MLTYEFWEKCGALVRLGEYKTPVLLRRHGNHYEPMIITLRGTLNESANCFEIQRVCALVYWDYTDGIIKRKELNTTQSPFETNLYLDPELSPLDLQEAYLKLEILRLALENDCPADEEERYYQDILKWYGLNSYRIPEYDEY